MRDDFLSAERDFLEDQDAEEPEGIEIPDSDGEEFSRMLHQPIIYGPVIDLNCMTGSPPGTQWETMLDSQGLVCGWWGSVPAAPLGKYLTFHMTNGGYWSIVVARIWFDLETDLREIADVATGFGQRLICYEGEHGPTIEVVS